VNVERMMRHNVRACSPWDSLNDAARIMWDDACGCVPVVDASHRPVGFLTDRDICMAAYTQGRPLGGIRVESAMAKKVVSCGIHDDIEHAVQMMRGTYVRRLPVVDAQGVLVGLLSLDDIACESKRSLRGATDHYLAGVVGDVHGTICFARCQRRHGIDPPLVSSAR